MKRFTLLLGAASLCVLTALAVGQWQVQPQIDPRVGPIYPVNPSFNFYSRQNNDPFQFNWASGRWDYTPFPDGGSSGRPYQYSPPPYRPNWNENTPYVFGTPMPQNPPPQSGTSPNAINTAVSPDHPTPSPDDSQLWNPPSTQPDKTVAPQIVKFEGRIMAIKAVSFMGEETPHLLIRLKNDAGAMGTIDAGQKLAFPDGAFDTPSKGYITVTGQLGMLDGHMLLFADKITLGSSTIPVERYGK